MTLPTITRARRRRNVGVLALAALLLAAAAALVALHPAGAASTAPALRAVVVSCGQTITVSIVVSNDLDDCPGYGLIVGANGITIDLGGHTIDGDAISGGDGVSNGGFDNVKIQDGTITGFGFGVRLSSSADGNKITNIRADFNTYGIVVEAGSEDATLTGISAAGNKHGVLISEADGLQVTNSAINGNGLFGVWVTDADDIVISGTKAVSNGSGISVDPSSRRAEIKTSVANSNRHDGILVETRTAKLTGNTALFNTELGIDATAGVTDGGGNKAHDNGTLHQCENVACG